MARIRTIKPEFWEDEKIAKLSMPCRLFFIGTWNYADDAGVFKANITLLKSKIFPYDDIRTSEIQKYLDALETARMILPISHNGESFYVIRTFRSHQKFDARYPNYLIDNEILRELLSTQLSPDGDTAGTQWEPATVRGRGRGNIIPPLPPLEGECADAQKWRSSFDIYITELQQAYKSAIDDQKWIAERERFHSNLDIKLTMAKAYKDYWGTETAWEKKRKSRKTQNINWRLTFNNALTQKMNQVYKPKNYEQKNNNDNSY